MLLRCYVSVSSLGLSAVGLIFEASSSRRSPVRAWPTEINRYVKSEVGSFSNIYRAPHTEGVRRGIQDCQSQKALRSRLRDIRMTAPVGLHATSDVHGGCAPSVSFADSLSRGLMRRTERSMKSRRKRDGLENGRVETRRKWGRRRERGTDRMGKNAHGWGIKK